MAGSCAVHRFLVVSALAVAATVAAPRTARAGDSCLRPSRDDAAIRLRAVAMGDPDPVAGLQATKLYLEALNELGSKHSRTACFDDMASDVPKLRELHCRAGSVHTDSEGCLLLDRIHIDIQRLRAQRDVEAADKKSTGQGAAQAYDAQLLYEKAGGLYLETFRQFCDEPVAAGRAPRAGGGTTHCAEIAYNAARAFTAARLAGKAVGAYRMLIAFDGRVKGDKGASPLATKALYELGAQYQSMALFEQAADSYERFAVADPRAPQASRAVIDAMVLRFGLGQMGEASRNAALFTKYWGATKQTESAQLALALALAHAERGENDKARAILKGAMEVIDRSPLDLQLRAHALLGRITPALAPTEFAKVRALWRDPRAAEAAVIRGWPEEGEWQHDRRLAHSLNAVGEAMFASAEARRLAEVAPLVLATYAGPRDRASVLAFVETKVRPWYEKKKLAIERLEAEYVAILELKPVPPPLWVIEAGAAVGVMWGAFADEFRRAPIPDAWKKDRALLLAYTESVDDMSGWLRTSRAKPAMKKCVDLAVKYQIADSRSLVCSRWLETNDKAAYPVVDEILPPFAGLNGARGAPVAPLYVRVE